MSAVTHRERRNRMRFIKQPQIAYDREIMILDPGHRRVAECDGECFLAFAGPSRNIRTTIRGAAAIIRSRVRFRSRCSGAFLEDGPRSIRGNPSEALPGP